MTPAQAYDLEMLPVCVPEVSDRGQGWCFGLPPGITQEQWPLDLFNGFPLKHGFTLLLPEDYRCHGPEIVALSFFGISLDHHDGGATKSEPVTSILQAAEMPPDPLLGRLWQAERSAHPRLHRMPDILGCGYAAILLTLAEFEGPFCKPPQHGYPRLFHGVPRPRWLDVGTGRDYWDHSYYPYEGRGPEDFGLYEGFSQVPDPDLAFNRSIRWFPRAQDPNAGKAPQETYGEQPPENSYQPPNYWQDGIVEVENWREHDWAKGHGSQHIGGTMRPIQWIPSDFSCYYVEFSEELGGFNFGGGNAQLDFQTMKFDWACG